MLQQHSRRAALTTIALGLASLAGGPALAGRRRHDHVPGETALVGLASFYGSEQGSHTASGEHFDPRGLTAAHRSLPLGSHVKVTNLANGKDVIVRINDRGPYIRSRVIDLSRGAAEKLEFIKAGVTRVRIEPASPVVPV